MLKEKLAIEILESLLSIFETPRGHGTVTRTLQVGKHGRNFHKAKDVLGKLIIAIFILSLNRVT